MSRNLNITRKLPFSWLKVGPHKFEVIVHQDNNWRDEHDCEGKTDLIKLQIHVVITEDRPLSFVLDTLLHEIFHAMWFTCSLKDEDKEEDIVQRLSTCWLQVLIDNPKLSKLLYTSIIELSTKQIV